MKNVNTRQLIAAAALAWGLLAAPVMQAATEILDQVVAIVDDDVIMASELRFRLHRLVSRRVPVRGRCW